MQRPASWKVLTLGAALTGLGFIGAGTAMAGPPEIVRESAGIDAVRQSAGIDVLRETADDGMSDEKLGAVWF